MGPLDELSIMSGLPGADSYVRVESSDPNAAALNE